MNRERVRDTQRRLEAIREAADKQLNRAESVRFDFTKQRELLRSPESRKQLRPEEIIRREQEATEATRAQLKAILDQQGPLKESVRTLLMTLTTDELLRVAKFTCGEDASSLILHELTALNRRDAAFRCSDDELAREAVWAIEAVDVPMLGVLRGLIWAREWKDRAAERTAKSAMVKVDGVLAEIAEVKAAQKAGDDALHRFQLTELLYDEHVGGITDPLLAMKRRMGDVMKTSSRA